MGNFLNQRVVGDNELSGGMSAAPHGGSAITPVISVPASGSPALSFDSWWEIESVAPASFDIMTVHILDSNGTELTQLARINPATAPPGSAPIAFSSAGPDVPGVWQNYLFPLTSYMGQDIRIKFQFSTNDGQFNGFRGWFIDEVKILGEAVVGINWEAVGTKL